MRPPGSTGAAEEEPILPLGEALEFMRLLWALDHRFRVESRRPKPGHQPAYSQQLVLRIVGRFPSLSPGQLARILYVDPSSVSVALDDLARKRLIVREPDPRDGRRVQLGLTAQGRAVDVPATEGIEAIVDQTLRHLPEARVEAAREVLQALVQALGASDAA